MTPGLLDDRYGEQEYVVDRRLLKAITVIERFSQMSINELDATRTNWSTKFNEPAANQDLILRLQLRFVRGNERANVGRHVQQLQPLFFIQGHGKATHSVDRKGSLFAYLHADTG
jgi:hypothetical protein